MSERKPQRSSREKRQEMLKEIKKPFDFEKAFKKGVFLNLDEETIQYFKDLATENGRGYQTLIDDALKYFRENKLKPKIEWK